MGRGVAERDEHDERGGSDERDERDELGDLPEAYALALVLHGEGLDEAAIAHALQIEVKSVAPMLTLARAKLANLEPRPEGDGEG